MTAAVKPRAATPENVAKLLQKRPKPAGQPPELVRCAGCGNQMEAGRDCHRCSEGDQAERAKPETEPGSEAVAPEPEAAAPAAPAAPACPTCGQPKSPNGRCYRCRPGGPRSKAEQAHEAVTRGERPAPAPRAAKPTRPIDPEAVGGDPELAAIGRALEAVRGLSAAARAYVVARLAAEGGPH